MSKRTYTIPSHVELDIRRMNGTVETVRCPAHIRALTEGMFAQIKASTAGAGRGEVLTYRNVEKTVVETDAQYAERLAGEAADRSYAAYKAGHDAVADMAAGGERWS